MLRPSFGWKSMVTNTRKTCHGYTRIHKKCLGVFCCEVSDCHYVEAPRQPRSKCVNAEPVPAVTRCQDHPETPLVYYPCQCKWSVTEYENKFEIRHKGKHNHPVPRMDRCALDPDSLIQLQQVVRTCLEATAGQLKAGTATRPSVTNIHPMLMNMDRLNYERRKITLKASKVGSGIADIINFIKDVDGDFIRSVELVGKHPNIIMQSNYMMQVLEEREGPLQTDTVEGFLTEPSSSKILYLTVTSTFDSMLA